MASELMEIYVDDSGVGRPQQDSFTMGMWLTWRPLMWRMEITKLRDKHRYPWAMHFHKMSHKERDRRNQLILDLFRHLAERNKTWYFRGFYVSPEHYPSWRGRYPNSQAIYDWALSTAANRFLRGIPEQRVRMVVEQRNRPSGDSFIPDGLRSLLERHPILRTKFTSVDVVVRENRKDDLLQVADCLTAAVRQTKIGCDNPWKHHCAEAIRWDERISDRLGVWEFHP